MGSSPTEQTYLCDLCKIHVLKALLRVLFLVF